MKKGTKFCALALCIALLAGCAGSLGSQAAISSKSDVFSTVKENMPIPAGSSELNISASLKTHKEFDCPINLRHAHGTPDYRLVLNIDGQSLPLDSTLKDENLTGTAIGNPEQGEGVRYTFRQRLAIPPGEHRIIISLPGESIAIERTIIVDTGFNTLAIEPVYQRKKGMRQGKTAEDFHEGIKGLRTILNGNLVY